MVFNTIVPKEFEPGVGRDLYFLEAYLKVDVVDAAAVGISSVLLKATLLSTHIAHIFHFFIRVWTSAGCGQIQYTYWVLVLVVRCSDFRDQIFNFSLTVCKILS